MTHTPLPRSPDTRVTACGPHEPTKRRWHTHTHTPRSWPMNRWDDDDTHRSLGHRTLQVTARGSGILYRASVHLRLNTTPPGQWSPQTSKCRYTRSGCHPPGQTHRSWPWPDSQIMAAGLTGHGRRTHRSRLRTSDSQVTAAGIALRQGVYSLILPATVTQQRCQHKTNPHARTSTLSVEQLTAWGQRGLLYRIWHDMLWPNVVCGEPHGAPRRPSATPRRQHLGLRHSCSIPVATFHPRARIDPRYSCSKLPRAKRHLGGLRPLGTRLQGQTRQPGSEVVLRRRGTPPDLATSRLVRTLP